MQPNKLFNQTRRRLALWYAGVMGVILSVSAFGVYRAIAHAHQVSLDRELASLANTLHNSLELKLHQPGKLEPIIEKFLPGICVNGSPCFAQIKTPLKNLSQCSHDQNTSFTPSPYTLSIIKQGNYYLRLLDLQGCLIAFAGDLPDINASVTVNKKEIFEDSQGVQYHQISILLHTVNQQEWGYIQVGSSFEEFHHYLRTIRWIIVLGLPIALGFVGFSSWGLAGLAMKPIYESYQQIQQFTADVAHELRTPLAATQATVESALRMDSLETQDSRDILLTIKRQNQRLTTLIQDLLLLSRLDKQSLTQSHQSCCLNDIVSDLVEELTPLAIASKIDLSLLNNLPFSLTVIGNEEQLYRLISNLMINAIQYTPTQGQVTVSLDSQENYALIHIQDTGIGIPLEEQKYIFNRFYRVSSDRSRQTGGSGLGLAIAQSIIQAHQGTIEVQSIVGKGSIFIIHLPLS